LDPGDIHFVQIKHTSPDTDIDWAQVPQISLPSKREPVWLTDNDVVFTSRGTRTLAYPLVGTPRKAVCAPQFFVLSVKDTGRLLPEFLAWQINQKPAQDYFQRTATGSYIQNIRREVIENLPIAIPSIQQQRLIVKFWRAAQLERATLNRLIENRNNQLEALAIDLLQTSNGVKE
jgi:restriction endonuclease S subunit